MLIIGAGQAGAQAAISLRQAGFAGQIVMLGAEPELPYQRPPLSKAFLKGEMAKDRLRFRPPEFYSSQAIELRLGMKASRLDKDLKIVTTECGTELPYDKLLIATGAPPRRFPGIAEEVAGVHYLRTVQDSEALRPILSCGHRVAIVGAGYIGLEVAAVARQAGTEVTVIEAADRVLARVAGQPVSDFYAGLHREAGVDLRLGCPLKGIVSENGRVVGVELANGEVVDCGTVLIGIGAAPEQAIASDAGLSVDNGIIVDDHARTIDPSIWAAGDCTNFPSLLYDRRMRLESVPNAIEHAKVAAANMCGGDSIHDALPWFWSDQYDVKLQTAGLNEGHNQVATRGNPAERKFAVWYLEQGVIVSVDAINDPASFLIGKKLVAQKARARPEQLIDNGFNLADLATAA